MAIASAHADRAGHCSNASGTFSLCVRRQPWCAPPPSVLQVYRQGPRHKHVPNALDRPRCDGPLKARPGSVLYSGSFGARRTVPRPVHRTLLIGREGLVGRKPRPWPQGEAEQQSTRPGRRARGPATEPPPGQRRAGSHHDRLIACHRHVEEERGFLDRVRTLDDHRAVEADLEAGFDNPCHRQQILRGRGWAGAGANGPRSPPAPRGPEQWPRDRCPPGFDAMPLPFPGTIAMVPPRDRISVRGRLIGRPPHPP